MEILLEILRDDARREVSVAAEAVLGRSPRCEIPIEDPAISSRHLRLKPAPEGIWFEDLGSSNGTFLDEAPIQAGLLAAGGVLRVGQTRIRIAAPAPSAEGVEPEPALLLACGAEHPFERALHRLATGLSARPDAEGLLAGLLEELSAEIPFHRGAYVLLWPGEDPDRGAVTASVGAPTRSGSVARRVLQTRTAVLCAAGGGAGAGAGAEGGSLRAAAGRAILAAPIPRGGRIAGILQVEADGLPFGDADLRAAFVLGSLVGALLDAGEARARARESERSRALLERYLSPDVADRIQRGAGAIRLGGEVRDVTVFFSDMRGFTSLTERTDPEALVRILNRFFGRITERVFAHRGCVDKFIGDAVMAVFGAPFPAVDDAARAVRMAREVRDEVAALAREVEAETGAAISMGYGLASGRVVAGNIGWEKRMDYTSIGDPVNLASRLTGAAGPHEILLDEETLRRAGEPAAVSRGEIPLKGKARPVAAYALT